MIEQRPWGHFEVLVEKPDLKLKRLVVQPGHRLSLQRHRHRHEHWYVLQGEAMVELDGQQVQLGVHASVDIAPGVWHRVTNTSAAEFVLIETQTGTYFGEDDIERREDDYGRSAGGASR